MNVAQLISGKPRNLISVQDTDTIRQAVETLNRHNVGALVVTNSGGDLRGIISERDVVRRVLTCEAGYRDQPVSEFMTQDVKTTTPDAHVNDVMNIMTQSRIRHLPVMESGQLVGVISIGDVVKQKIAESEEEAAALRDYIHAG